MCKRNREVKADEARRLWESGTPYPDMRRLLGNITRRHVARLLREAGVRRDAGRPNAQPDGDRVSFDEAGLT